MCLRIARFAIKFGLTQGTKPPPRPNIQNIWKITNPPPWVGPEKNTKIVVFVLFCMFSVILSFLPGPNQGGGSRNFVIYFHSFFRTWGVFVPCTSPKESQSHKVEKRVFTSTVAPLLSRSERRTPMVTVSQNKL